MLRKYIYLLAPAPAEGGASNPPAAAEKPAATTPEAAPEAKAETLAETKSEEAPKPPVAGKDDPLLAALFRDFGPEEPEIKPVAEGETKAAEAPKAETVKPAEAAKTEEAAPVKEAAKPESKPKAPRKKKASILSELDAPVAPAATPPPTVPTAPTTPTNPPADPDEDYINGLTADQKDELSEAEYAEKLFADKYKGRRKALLKWYRELDATAAKLLAEDPERKLNEEDADWQKFMRTKPRIEAAHVKAVQRTIGAETAVKQVEQKYEPKLTELERKQQEIEIRPKIEGVVQEFTSGVGDLLAQDEKSPLADAVKFAKEKGEAEAAKEFPLETQIRNEEVARATDMTREYFLFAKQIRSFDAKNPVHTALLTFINDEGRRFAQHGGDMLIRDGRRFLPREDYMRLTNTNPQELAKHWTFSHRDVVEMLAFQTKINIENRLKAEEERAKALGFERRQKSISANPPKQKDPEPINPPKATPTPAMGTSASGRGDRGAGAIKGDPIDVVAALGLRQ